MKAIGYIRVSTDRQELGPEAQRMAIEEKARALGLTVEIFEDIGVSGKTEHEDRIGLTLALDALPRGSVFIVYKLDRLSRDLLQQLLIDKMITGKGGRLLSCSNEGTEEEGPMGKLLRQILGAIAEFEREMIRVRTRMALKVKRDKGEKLGGKVQYGYRKEGKMLVPVMEEQEVISRVRKAVEEQIRPTMIARMLNESGVPTKNGCKWRATQIKRMI